MNAKITRFFNHLMRRRVLIWMVTLFLIVGFAAAGGAILWFVQMNVTYRAEIRPQTREGGDESITAIIPATSRQSIKKNDRVIIIPSGKRKLEGIVRSVTVGPEKIKLKITGSGLPREKCEADITLRAERLLAAFLR